MRKQLLSPSIVFLVFSLYCSLSLAQTPAPAPAGPTNVTAILEKAGQFTTFIRLLKSTQEADQINTQLNNSNQGLTIFAPPDNAFANLKAGSLNSLSDQEKVQLVQFHILPTFISMSNFQTVSNPLRTQAGDSANGEFPLNVTTSGNQVNITTGVNTGTVANSIYTDGQLAVYQVDQVLLPLQLFGSSSAPAPAPAPAEAGKDVPAKAPAGGSKEDASVDASAASTMAFSFSIAFIAAMSWKL
ncbi:Fasciclin-like arabinogalactan protein 11 [Turnera subulata]|uniref:Fasciclin-like arabinogalactan protein 11 n=1 Tax=Turnera subulata TaxID=218843 RepID=A0A9Q0FER0_9ROSI|nr:Fasciclin-like arabinogalactan protein 11 [Turnera subulata]